MASDWEIVKLSDFVDIKTGFPFKSKQYLEHGEGYKLLRGDNVVQGAFRWANVKLWSKDELTEKQKGYFLEEGDVILAMDRPWIEAGLKTAQITNKDLPCLLVQRVARLQAKNSEDQDFLRYLVSSYWFVEYLKLVQTGTAIPHISTKQILSYETKIPPLIERKNIGRLLRSLDDKIELNRQMNETLEAMAQALFKSWFVNFDPVIDNALAADNAIPDELLERAEQRKAIEKKDNSDIQALFPDEFEFTEEMGWIPKGWKVTPLASLIKLTGGGTPKTSIPEYWNGNIPWFSVVDAPSSSDVFVLDTEKYVTSLGVENSSTKILSVGTTIISARGTVGKCAMVSRPMAMNQSCYGVSGNEGISNTFVYYSVFLSVSELQSKGHGSVFNTITGDTFKSINVAFGGGRLTRKFDDLVNPYFEKILGNSLQAKTLSKLRDTLLPKLMSGELRISDAAELVDKAV